jgi:hypothetical protein
MKLGFEFMPNSAHRDVLRGFTLVFQHRSWPPVQAMAPDDRLNLSPRVTGHRSRTKRGDRRESANDEERDNKTGNLLGACDTSQQARLILAGTSLPFAQAEGNEAMSGIVRRKPDCHAVPWDHTDTKSTHPTGQLSRDLLPGLKSNLITAAAQNLVDTAGGLNKIVSRQKVSPAIGYPTDQI